MLKRTDSGNPDFQELANELELDLKDRDGNNHSFYADLNKIDKLHQVLVFYENETPVGCGGLRSYSTDRMEVKRMYVRPAYRGRGVATVLLTGLENWTKELGYKFCVLETGKNQPEAIGLYRKYNYRVISNFGPYRESPNSVCFEKLL